MSTPGLDPGNTTLQAIDQYLCTRVPIASPNSRAGDIRRTLVGQDWEVAADVAICDGETLVGLLEMEKLLSAPEDQSAAVLMDSDPPVVAPGLDQEQAAWKMVQHGESSLAVVDSQGRFLGLVPAKRLLAVLLAEHEEDMARMGGFLRGASLARTASQESVGRRFWHRLPWLLLGLLGALVAADLIGSFETQLQANLALAFFIPGIVYLADAVGTQTETLIIRGLSVGVSIRQVIWREIVTGMLVGLALCLAFFPIALLRWQDAGLALAVSVSILAACSTATVVALSLPWVFHRFGKDPAFGTGPLATVIQDLLSIAIYLAISLSLVGRG
jgi:magnesium transporter